MTNNEMLYQHAIVSLNTGNFIDAERSFRSFLKSQQEHVGALNLLTLRERYFSRQQC
jgi:hypothetical protein